MGSLAAVAGTAVVGAYLDAKFHISKDIRTLYNLRTSARQYDAAEKVKRASLWYPFEAVVERMPDEECLWSRTGSYSWQETHEHMCRYAQFILSLGVTPGDLLAFDLTNSCEFIFAHFGTWAIGATPAMMNYNLAGEALIHCLKVSGAKIVLVDEEVDVIARMEEIRAKVEGELGMRIVILDTATKAQIMALEPKRPGNEFRDNVKGPDPAMLIYTSGTTGLPKAVPFTTQRLWDSVGPRVRHLGIQTGPGGGRWYNPMPLYHGTGAIVLIMSLTSGVALCVGKKFSAKTFWQDVRDSRATAFVYVGETARYLLTQPPSPRDKDHNVTMMFGNGLRPDVWKRFQDRFGIETVSEFFNSSEGVFSLLNISKGDFLATAVGHHGLIIRTLLRKTFVPVEVDYATNDILRIPSATDPSLATARRLPHSVGGEIIVAVPSEKMSGFAGYWKNESATSKKFAKDVFKKGDLYYRSGDALRRDDDGRWFFLDRLGDTYRWKSENVSTAEVAIVCGEFPGVVEANVYGVLIPRHDGRAGCVAVYIPAEQRASFDFKAFHAYLKTKLPRYAVPVFLRLVTEMSPMHNNKQNKVPLRNEGVDIEKIANGTSPGDTLMWCPAGGEGYVPFGQKEWDLIDGEKAKL